MGKRRKPSPPSRAKLAVLTTAAAGTAVLVSSTNAYAAPKPDLATVKKQVDALYEEAEASIEKFNGAEERAKKLQGEANQLQTQLAEGQEKLNAVQSQLGGLAAAQYRNGGVDPSLQLMLSSDPDSYLRQASVRDQEADTQLSLLRQAQKQQQRLDQQRAETAATLAALDANHKALAEEKNKVQTKLAEAKKILNSLTAAERAQVDVDEAGRASRGAAADRVELPQVPASGRAAAVLKFAQAQLGKPYIWGAEGPAGFDCSGLTLRAWEQAGVRLPRVSQDQWNAGTRISRANLQPGDLVFFFSDLHHVGIYIGNNKMIHAPRTGKNVTVLDLQYMPDYMGAVRPG
ncbi:NlpC/P60 family protein [Kitasatospora sp. NPDC051853]|uniref:C40 family peptidase n=1 Tax=Kitasatospora sp. NPDC051853 TaxID=3364058 RepID=UPI00379D86AB